MPRFRGFSPLTCALELQRPTLPDAASSINGKVVTDIVPSFQDVLFEWCGDDRQISRRCAPCPVHRIVMHRDSIGGTRTWFGLRGRASIKPIQTITGAWSGLGQVCLRTKGPYRKFAVTLCQQSPRGLEVVGPKILGIIGLIGWRTRAQRAPTTVVLAAGRKGDQRSKAGIDAGPFDHTSRTSVGLLDSQRRISEQAAKTLQTCHQTLIPNLQTRPPAELALENT